MLIYCYFCHFLQVPLAKAEYLVYGDCVLLLATHIVKCLTLPEKLIPLIRMKQVVLSSESNDIFASID